MFDIILPKKFLGYKRRNEKGQTKICKTLSRKLKIEQHEPPLKMVMDSGTPPKGEQFLIKQ